MPTKILRSLPALACTLLLRAGGWPPVPPEVWAMKEDPAKGITGAVVLENRMVFTGSGIRHVLRLRILSERGKAVAELPAFLPEATNIEGRTVQPDGTVTTFDKTKDFNQKTISVGQTDRELKVMLPPGLTANCLVELRWFEAARGDDDHQLPDSLGYSGQWRLGGPFLTRETVVEFWPRFSWSCSMNPGNVKYPEAIRDGRHITYTFNNIPGLEQSPYTMESLSGRPTLQAWKQPYMLTSYERSNPDKYWSEAAHLIFRNYYWKELKKGSAYEALAKALLEGLPPGPEEAAQALGHRLDRRILNQTYATHEENARLKKGETLAAIDSRNLEAAAEKGRTDGEGMTLLYLSLAAQAGLHPRLVFVRDRTQHMFHYDLPDVWQLRDMLVGIPVTPERTFWVDPSLRFATPGLVPPEYQGVNALVMDTETWTAKAEPVPAQPPEFNRSRYQFKLDFTGGEERLSVKAGFKGYPELMERRKYLVKSQEEADRSLKEAMEGRIKDCTVTQAAVSGVWDPDLSAGWAVDGRIELDAPGALSLDPFPGMPLPLKLPTAWPAPRTVPIMMEYLRTHEAECELRVPAGYVLQPSAPLQRENAFGKVLFSVTTRMDGATTVALVTLKVELNAIFAPASGEPDLKRFLAWIEDACHRRILLEKA